MNPPPPQVTDNGGHVRSGGAAGKPFYLKTSLHKTERVAITPHSNYLLLLLHWLPAKSQGQPGISLPNLWPPNLIPKWYIVLNSPPIMTCESDKKHPPNFVLRIWMSKSNVLKKEKEKRCWWKCYKAISIWCSFLLGISEYHFSKFDHNFSMGAFSLVA